jgi:hypothetical protein
MRTLLIGLAIAATDSAVAQAASCPATRAKVQVVDTGYHYAGVDLMRSDLVGKIFRVSRYTVRRTWHFSKPIGAKKLLGYEGYELKGSAGTFEVMRDHIDGVPSVTPVSWASGSKDAYRQIQWGGGRPEQVTVGKDVDYVLDGPLSALTLRVMACR